MGNCEAEEMYLETVLLLSRQKGYAGRVDIAENMNVSKHSVTFAIIDTQLLMHIGADPVETEVNTCRMEHVVSNEMTEVIGRFMNQDSIFS